MDITKILYDKYFMFLHNLRIEFPAPPCEKLGRKKLNSFFYLYFFK